MTDYRDEYRRWCEDSYFDDKTRQELKALTSEEEIKDRFSRELEFGTGGLRGIMGAGLNRMNRYTVRKATQGLANYINSQERTARIRAWPSPTTPAACPRNLPWRRRSVSAQMA